MIEAFVYVDRGALVIEAADEYRSVSSTSASAIDPGPAIGAWYITSEGRIVWSRPYDTIRQWRWLPDDPEDPKPGEGEWELSQPGRHVSIAGAFAVLAAFGPAPDGLNVRWFNEDQNNSDIRGEIRIASDGPLALTIRPLGYAGATVVRWDGPGDFNADGAADVFDFLAFQTSFSDGEMVADYDRDGTLTLFDFLAFMGHH